MKTLVHLTLTFMLLQLLSGSHMLLAQSCSAKASEEQFKQMSYLKGEWQGTLLQNNRTEPLTMRFYENGDQLMVAISGAEYAGPLNAQASICAPAKFHFFGETAQGEEFRFNANDRDGSLEGTVAIGKGCRVKNKATFQLSRIPSAHSSQE